MKQDQVNQVNQVNQTNIEGFQATPTGFVLTNTDIIIIILLILAIYFWPALRIAVVGSK